MALLVSGYALQLIFLITSAITVTACAMYFRSVRSRASLMMLVGAGGGLLTSAVTTAMAIEFQRHLLSGLSATAVGKLSTQRLYVSMGTSAIDFCFALIFSISLFLVLRDAAQRHGGTTRVAESHPSAASAAGPA